MADSLRLTSVETFISNHAKGNVMAMHTRDVGQ